MKNKERNILIVDLYAATGIFFLLTFLYFFFFGKYILAFQETQFLFVFSADYLHQHLQKPGALLEYAARFLMQFYAGRLPGALVLSVVLTLPAVLIMAINKRLMTGISNAAILLMLVPSSLLTVMQAYYYHMMEYNLGFVVILACYLAFVGSDKKYNRIVVLVLFPFLYFIAGAYATIFAVMFVVHQLVFERGRRGYLFSFIILLIAVLTFFLAWKIIFLQPVQQFILFPLPLLESRSYRVIFVLLGISVVFYPFISRKIISFKWFWFNRRVYTLIICIVLFTVTGLLMYRVYNPQTSRIVELQRLVFNNKFDDAIKFQEKYPARNLIGQYFFNYALSETDQLCDRLFSSDQDFLAGSLILPWGNEHLNRGAYFYYAVGLINEAQRWAFEEMVVYGPRPQNIKLLAKVNLINGNYAMARKYLHILGRTIYYRKWAEEFEKLADNPDLIKTHPELGAKLNILPKNDFFILFNQPQNNLALILEGQPDNRKAIQYYLAGLLLTKKVEIAVNNIRNLKTSGFTRIPKHIEEAVMIYYNSTGRFPDLGGLTVSNETQSRFSQYFNTYVTARNNQATLKETMHKSFGDTFWYYFHFK